MFPPVLKHVHECVPHFTGRREVARMVAIRPDTSMTPQRPIHGFRDADGETLDSASKRDGIVALDQQVNVVRLDAEVHETKPAP